MNLRAVKHPVSTSILVLLTACLSSSLFAQQVYKWQDAKGATHYTQTPPPATAVGAKKVEVRSRTNLQPVAPVSDNAAVSATANKATANNQTAAATPQKPRLKQEDCKLLKDAVDTMATGRRIYESDEKGERVYLTEEQRTERINTYTKNMTDGCN